MVEERLEAGDATLDSLSSLEKLKIGQDEMRLHPSRHDERFDRIEHRLDKLVVGQEVLIDQLKQIAEGHAATRPRSPGRPPKSSRISI